MGSSIRGLYRYPDERTPSVKLYHESQSFFDFGRGIGGDCIALWSHVKKMSNGEAVREICETFNIEGNCSDEDIRRKIREQEIERKEQERAKKLKQKQWNSEVDKLKTQLERDNTLLLGHAGPFTDVRKWALEDLQLVEYRLDAMCGIE